MFQIISISYSFFRAIEDGDKESFKMNLNHILSCRSWDILPDIMDMFESANQRKDLAYFMKTILGKKIREAFQALCKLLFFRYSLLNLFLLQFSFWMNLLLSMLRKYMILLKDLERMMRNYRESSFRGQR